ncbi:MAG: hypothetical protein VCB07_00510, partial [Gammaproteobacteria bacterium]
MWATENGQVSYRTISGTGFEQICIGTNEFESVITKLNGGSAPTDSLIHFDTLLGASTAMVLDPGGHPVR